MKYGNIQAGIPTIWDEEIKEVEAQLENVEATEEEKTTLQKKLKTLKENIKRNKLNWIAFTNDAVKYSSVISKSRQKIKRKLSQVKDAIIDQKVSEEMAKEE